MVTLVEEVAGSSGHAARASVRTFLALEAGPDVGRQVVPACVHARTPGRRDRRSGSDPGRKRRKSTSVGSHVGWICFSARSPTKNSAAWRGSSGARHAARHGQRGCAVENPRRHGPDTPWSPAGGAGGGRLQSRRSDGSPATASQPADPVDARSRPLRPRLPMTVAPIAAATEAVGAPKRPRWRSPSGSRPAERPAALAARPAARRGEPSAAPSRRQGGEIHLPGPPRAS